MRVLLVLIILLLAIGLALWQFNVIGGVSRGNSQEQISKALLSQVAEASVSEIEDIILAGADVNAQNREGQTVLMLAASSNDDPEVISKLISEGAAVNQQNNEGQTALMLSAELNKNPEVALMLLNAGADPTFSDQQGKTASDYAADNGTMRRSGIFFMLEELIANPFDSNWPSGFIPPVQGATFSERPNHLPGARRAYRNGYHEGFDFYYGVVGVAINYATPVLATANGTVIKADHDYVEMTPDEYQALIDDAVRRPITPQESLDKLRGRQVWLEHTGGWISRYVHLSGIPEGLNVGDTVTQGEVVGYTGNSGTIEGVNLTQDEPHPHYELWRGDEGYLGEGLSPEEIYPIVAQVFGEGSLPGNLR